MNTVPFKTLCIMKYRNMHFVIFYVLVPQDGGHCTCISPSGFNSILLFHYLVKFIVEFNILSKSRHWADRNILLLTHNGRSWESFDLVLFMQQHLLDGKYQNFVRFKFDYPSENVHHKYSNALSFIFDRRWYLLAWKRLYHMI